MLTTGPIRLTLAGHQDRREEKSQSRDQEHQRQLAIPQRQREADQRALCRGL